MKHSSRNGKKLYVCCVVLLGVKHEALHLLDKSSTTWATSQPFML
jgi:hypothetical protein